MRIFDRPCDAGNPIRIAVIGSCRVLEPFEDMATTGKLVRVWANPQSASHNFGEAHQVLQYTLKRRDLPVALQPFIFEVPELAPEREPAQRRLLESVDLFVVEVSELRELRYEDYFFQADYFWRRFASHYGAPILPWYRALTSGQAIGSDIIDAALAGLNLHGEERERVEQILRHTHFGEGDIDAAVQWIDEIRFTRSADWVFVSHFIVPGVAESQMRSRRRSRDILRAAAADRGVTMFDPTDIVERLGRETALAQGGADIYHYNPIVQAIVAETILAAVPARACSDVAGASASSNIVASAATLNQVLVPFYQDRLRRLGRDASGLYAHYEALLEGGELIGQPIVRIIEVIIRLLPQYKYYHVFRAGLGEVSFLLASLGRQTLAVDGHGGRFEAIEAGAEYLLRGGFVRDGLLRAVNQLFPEHDENGETLAIVTQFTARMTPEQEEEALTRFERYHGLVVDPRNFLRERPTFEEREALIEKLHSHGFKTIREFPAIGVVYCTRG